MKLKKRKANHVCPDTCVICGDPANGHHYQIPACYACKNFFRRSIVGMKKFRACTSEGKCLKETNKALVKRCRACRFARCIESGMNPLCIGSDVPPEDNPVVQQVLKQQNRAKCCKPKEDTVQSCEPQQKKVQCCQKPCSSQGSPLEVAIKSPPEVKANRLIEELTFLEKAHDKIRHSRFSPMPKDGTTIAELLRGHSKLANIYDADNMRCTSNERTSNRKCCGKLCKVWPHADLVYSIEYVKTFEVFKRLNPEEQYRLIRSTVAMCDHLTKSYFSFKMKSYVTYHPDGTSVTVDRVSESPHKREFHYESVERVRELEMDESEYVLLKAIIVCDPTINGIDDCTRVLLEDQRALYAKSLFSYMTAKTHQAPRRFVEMLKLIEWLRGVNERRKAYHLLRTSLGLRPWYCNANTVDKLVDEIFL